MAWMCIIKRHLLTPASAILCLVHQFPINEGSQTLSLLNILEIILQEVAIEHGYVGQFPRRQKFIRQATYVILLSLSAGFICGNPFGYIVLDVVVVKSVVAFVSAVRTKKFTCNGGKFSGHWFNFCIC